MNKARKETARKLGLLAAYMGTVPDKRFDMGAFFTSRHRETVLQPPEVDCGTVACIGGWATTIPEFQKAGLCLNNVAIVWLKTLPHRDFGELSLRTFFGLTRGETEYLFYGPRCNVKEAVRRIRTIATKYE